MGKFWPQSGYVLPAIGGAPPIKQEEVKPQIFVKSVNYTKKSTDDTPIIIIKEVK